MGSLNIRIMRDECPGKPDDEAARAFAKKKGYIAIVRYKNSASGVVFTDIGCCKTEEEIGGYLSSPYGYEAEVIYDGRATALRITEDLILRGSCELCGKRATRESLQLKAGHDFYICPKCGLMFCDACYVRLPLTASPGYGMCPKCRIQVQRAIPGFYGDQSGNPARSSTGIENVRSSQSGDGELILNLWYVTDRVVISSLRAKFYIASGSDDEKLRFLRERANHDFDDAQTYPVPEDLKVDVTLVDGSAKVDAGKACTHSTLKFMGGYPALFREIILCAPKGVARFDPSQAMMCITGLVKGPDGNLSVQIDKTSQL